MQEQCSFLHLGVQFEYGFRNEKVWRMKIGYFKKSCPTNFDKILNFVKFENGGTDFQWGILRVMLNI